MKRLLIANAVLVGVLASRLMAEDVDGKMIHHYTFVEGGYGYLHEIGDGDINAHGLHTQLSFEQHNVVVTFGGGHFWGDDSQNFWNLNTSIGYVFRFAGNHLNLIPRFGAVYSDATEEVEDASTLFGNETWSITPGATISYALNNRIALIGSYAYNYNLDEEEGDHVLSVGPKVAIFEQMGVSVRALLSDEDGFMGVMAGVEFHF